MRTFRSVVGKTPTAYRARGPLPPVPELKAKGVELPEEPTKRDYGTDFGFRDPFGNHVRIAQLPC